MPAWCSAIPNTMLSPPVRSTGQPRRAAWRLVSTHPLGERWRFRPVTAVHVAVTCLLIAQLGRIPLVSTGDREAPLLINDVCLLAVLGIGALNALVSRTLILDRASVLALLFCAVGFFSAVLAIPRYGLTIFQVAVSLAYLARWMVYFGLYVVIINVARSRDVLALWRTLERTILMFAAFGLVQAAFIPGFAQVVYPNGTDDWDKQGHRLVSTVLEPNMAGIMIVLVLLVQFAQFSSGGRVAGWKPSLLLAALVATLSRSSFLALIVGGLVVLTIRGVSKRFVRFAVLGALVLVAALPNILSFARSYNKLRLDSSALGRLVQWARAFTVFSDHPIGGIGFNTFGFVQESYGFTRLGAGTYSTDGGLLFIAVMTGVVGLALYVGMFFLVIRRCRATWRNPTVPRELSALSIGVAAGSIALCVHSLFVNSILTTFVMEMVWLLWGLSFVIASSVSDDARLADPRPEGRQVSAVRTGQALVVTEP